VTGLLSAAEEQIHRQNKDGLIAMHATISENVTSTTICTVIGSLK